MNSGPGASNLRRFETTNVLWQTCFAGLHVRPAHCALLMQVVADPYARPKEAHPLPSQITLYQYEVCPYCCKVRAFLDYYKVRGEHGARCVFHIWPQMPPHPHPMTCNGIWLSTATEYV